MHVMQLNQCPARSRCSLKHTIVITIVNTAVVHWYLLSMADTQTSLGSSQANFKTGKSLPRNKAFALAETAMMSPSESLAAARGR